MSKEFPGRDRFVECLGIAPKERVLILSDRLVDKKALQLILEGCLRLSSYVELDLSLPLKLSNELPKRFHQRLRQAEVIILAASQSWYHTPLRQELKYRFRKRVVECYNIDIELLKKGALCADYGLIKIINAEFKKKLLPKHRIQIVTKGGTDFTAQIRKVKEEVGIYTKPGSGGNLPAGELSLGIYPQTARGRIVFDLSFDVLGELKGKPIEVKIQQGKIHYLSGLLSARLKQLLTSYPSLKKIAEIGIGTNPFGIIGRGVLEDEKCLGTLHIGFGNNVYFGGRNQGPHYDGVLLKPTFSVDGVMIIHQGRILRDLFGKCLSARLRPFGVLD